MHRGIPIEILWTQTQGLQGKAIDSLGVKMQSDESMNREQRDEQQTT